MNPEMHQKIQAAFETVVTRPPGERSAALAEISGSDATLRHEVESLLGHYADDDVFLESPAIRAHYSAVRSQLLDEMEDDAESLILPGVTVGQYTIRNVIARGGMGIVYEAEQKSPRRTVALKVLRHGFGRRSMSRRFRSEAEILGSLRHPNIAQIYEAGVCDQSSTSSTSSELPYIAMEFVPQAQTLLEYAGSHALSHRERIGLFFQACAAVEHGHQRGVIHRDLKPANLLVDESAQIKVIDFGVARTTCSHLGLTTHHTLDGELVGTVAYMSPEQCHPSQPDVDVRSDVYSLAVVLYELLAGVMPYDTSGFTIWAATQTIRGNEPRRLSSLNPRLRGDIETIVHKALEKDRNRRYQSVAEFSSDLQRYLQGVPIAARPMSATYQLAKFVERHRWQSIAAVVAVMLLLVSGIAIGFGILAQRASENARLAATAQRGALQSAVVGAIQAYDIKSARALLDQVPPDERRWEWHHLLTRLDLSASTIKTRTAHTGEWGVVGLSISPDGKWISSKSGARVGGELGLWDVESGESTVLSNGIDSMAGTGVFAFSPDSDFLAVVQQLANEGEAGEKWCQVAIWSMTERRIVGQLPPCRLVCGMAFKPGERFILAIHQEHGPIELWDLLPLLQSVSSGTNPDGPLDPVKIVRLEGSSRAGANLEFSRNGHLLAASGYDREIRIWDVANPRLARCITTLRGHNEYVSSISFNSNSRWLASGSSDGTIRLWDLKECLRSSSQGDNEQAPAVRSIVISDQAAEVVTAVAFHPSDEGMLATAGTDRVICLWRIEQSGDTTEPGSGLPDGWQSAEADQVETEGQVERLQCQKLAVLHGHGGRVKCLQFTPDGRWLVSGAEDGEIKLWYPGQIEVVPTLMGHSNAVSACEFTADGRFIVTGSLDGTIRVWETLHGVATDVLVPSLRESGDMSRVHDIAISPDNKELAAACDDGLLMRWSMQEGGSWPVLSSLVDSPGHLKSVCYSADGQFLVTGSADGKLNLWRVPVSGSHELFHEWVVCFSEPVESVKFSANGEWVIAGTGDSESLGCISVVKTSNGELSWSSGSAHSLGVSDIALDSTGQHLATSSFDGTVKVWDCTRLPQLTMRRMLTGHTDQVRAVCFHPSQARLLSGSRDSTIRVWDYLSGVEMLTLRGHLDAVNDLAFDRTGQNLVSVASGYEGTGADAKIWKTQ